MVHLIVVNGRNSAIVSPSRHIQTIETMYQAKPFQIGANRRTNAHKLAKYLI